MKYITEYLSFNLPIDTLVRKISESEVTEFAYEYKQLPISKSEIHKLVEISDKVFNKKSDYYKLSSVNDRVEITYNIKNPTKKEIHLEIRDEAFIYKLYDSWYIFCMYERFSDYFDRVNYYLCDDIDGLESLPEFIKLQKN